MLNEASIPAYCVGYEKYSRMQAESKKEAVLFYGKALGITVAVAAFVAGCVFLSMLASQSYEHVSIHFDEKIPASWMEYDKLTGMGLLYASGATFAAISATYMSGGR